MSDPDSPSPLYDSETLTMLEPSDESLDASSSDDSTPADGSTAIATQPAITIAFKDCIRCGSPTVDRCACCSRHLHENCAPVSGDPIFFCEQCGEELVEDALAVAEPRMGGARDAVVAVLAPFFISSE
uniref:Zinc finger PHD-type domain-containing protein n=1 Tax=Plectus sambesii TaxID=2011161 RepID=A0A914VUH0_9BILA